MKRLFIILTLVGSSIFTSSYANGTYTTPVVQQSFETAFTGAKNITWVQVGVLYKASFELNGQCAAAFYNADGDLVATTKNISSTKLPQSLRASLKKALDGNWITDAFVVSVEGNETYYVKIENANTTVTLKSSGSKKWDVYQKFEK